MKKVIEDVAVSYPKKMSTKEVRQYILEQKSLAGDLKLVSLDLVIDGAEVELKSRYEIIKKVRRNKKNS